MKSLDLHKYFLCLISLVQVDLIFTNENPI